MRIVAIAVLALCGFVFFAYMSNFTYVLNGTSAWQGMNGTTWENALIMIGAPFGMLGFAFYLIMQIFKGKKPTDGGQV